MTSDNQKYVINIKLAEGFSNINKIKFPEHVVICIDSKGHFKILDISNNNHISSKWCYIFSEREGLHMVFNIDEDDNVFAFVFPINKGNHGGHYYNIDQKNGLFYHVAHIHITNKDEDLPDFSEDLKIDNGVDKDRYMKILDNREKRRIELNDYKPDITTYSDNEDDDSSDVDESDNEISSIKKRLTNIEDKLDRLLDIMS